MSVQIERLGAADAERWDRFVDRSAGANFFHRNDALAVQAEYGNATLHRLVGYDDEEPVGVFPLFSMRRGPFDAAFSPPPKLWVPRQGPCLLDVGPSSRRERLRIELIEEALDWLAAEVGPRYVRVRTTTRLGDVRPFQWWGADLTPEYTYVVDLSAGEEEVLSRFSGDARRNVRAGEETESAYRIEVGGREDVEAIMEQVRQRYRSQDTSFAVPDGFLPALYERLPAGRVRPHVLRVGEEFVGGIVSVDDGDRVVGWHGGVKPAADVDLPVNDLLDWHVMRDAMDRGRTEYEIAGAGDPRLNRYKAKFAPELRAFYTVERSSVLFDLVVDGARRLSLV